MATRPTWIRATLVLAAFLMAVATVAGCGSSAAKPSALSSPSAAAPSPEQPSASATWDLHIDNGTKRAVTILVDGATVASVAAGGSIPWP